MTAHTLVTGGSGFVGSAVLARLRHSQLPALGVVRRAVPVGDCVRGPALEGVGDWSQLLQGCAVVVHTAARVHVMRDSASDPLNAYRAANVEGTVNLARQAAAAGVRRFVFISSIKVNGEETAPGRPFTSDDRPSPLDPYGMSKAEAESGLKALAAATGMEVVIIRPPLVYGPGVKANFLNMMRWLRLGVPLPLGAVEHNRRSFVALDNLVDLIVTCIDHPAAANRTFLVSDDMDLSTSELLRRLAAAIGVSARLFPVPVWALHAGAKMTGRNALFQRLCGNLQVDIATTREALDWCPPIGVDEGLRRAAEGFRA
ncbi:UDP-glucose 4-epimerase family protein [Aromatoleum evansii]|uniref:UDP-glucose 4-epimerase family protein n=1 Tax=Aromatoleum evansii TaxID=59406 RepID=UPI00145DD359|nr:SDR family oxidoreductase [Aromatoleum evansii]NMG28893.1 NAD-dependent epimerase/dehydratase family protein [Aromatoleum evansii]